MGRSRNKEFRYQRINFDDDDDDNTDLARALGATSSDSSVSCARLLRGCCIISTILATVALIATTILYGSVIFPNTTESKVSANRTDLSGLGWEPNSTLGLTNETEGESNSTLSGSVDTVHGPQTHINATQPPPSNESHVNTNPGDAMTNQTSESGLNATRINSTQVSNATLAVSGETTELVVQDVSQVDNENRHRHPIDGPPSSSAAKRKPSGTFAPHTRSTTRSLLEAESTRDPTEALISDRNETHPTETSSSQNSNALPETPGLKRYLVNFDGRELLAISVVFSATVVAISLTIFFVLCLLRRRRRAKKNHFSRLINDLNATEKFSIEDTLSEDETSD
eukprot:maker-scaffold1268_size51707-snap-gene-0.16 protein:Tk07216 transcript:maker-scaffold1268_size51707-snap-gene-0.16-mRNA-1 annotation:"chromosome condensation and segregation smc atpase"